MTICCHPFVFEVGSTARPIPIALAIVIKTTLAFDNSAIDGFDYALSISLSKLFQKGLALHLESVTRI